MGRGAGLENRVGGNASGVRVPHSTFNKGVNRSSSFNFKCEGCRALSLEAENNGRNMLSLTPETLITQSQRTNVLMLS